MKKLTVLLCLLLLAVTFVATINAESEVISDDTIVVENDEEGTLQDSLEQEENTSSSNEEIIEEIPAEDTSDVVIEDNMIVDLNSADSNGTEDSNENASDDDLAAVRDLDELSEDLNTETVGDDNTKTDIAALVKGTVIYSDSEMKNESVVLNEDAVVCVQLNNDNSAEVIYSIAEEDRIELKKGYVSFADVIFLSSEQIEEWQKSVPEFSIKYKEWNLMPVVQSMPDEPEQDLPEKADDNSEIDEDNLFDFGYEEVLGDEEQESENESDLELELTDYEEKNEQDKSTEITDSLEEMLSLDILATSESSDSELRARAGEGELRSRAAESDFVVDSTGVIVEYKGSSTAITIPETVGGVSVTGLSETAFSRNTSINYVTIHDKITYIERGVFKGCTGLLSVSMPNEITYISAEAFEGCTSLQSVSWPAQLTTIEHDAFKDCTSFAGLALSTGIKYIEDNAFSGCTGLTYVDLPSDLETIGSGAFQGCSALKEIIIPDTVKEIGNSAFEGCSSAKTLELSSILTEIKNFSFKGCNNITDVIIPSNVTSIGREAFNSCSSLATIDIPASVTNVGVNAFANIANRPYFMIYTTGAAYSENALGSSGIVLGYSESTAEDYCSTRTDLTFRSIKIVDFVKTAYTQILGRTADRSGLLSNVKALAERSASATGVINGFISSTEFKKRKISEVGTLPILYQAMLGRTIDTSGQTAFTKLLNENGVSIYYVINEISKTYEFDLFCNDRDIIPGSIALTQNRDQNAKISGFVVRCYTKLLGRTFDVDGLNNWAGGILRKEKTGTDIVIGFIRSKEYKSFGLSNSASVERLYTTMLDRASDSAGKAYWLLHMSHGATIEHVVDGFSNSKEFKNICNDAGMEHGTVDFAEARDVNYNITDFVYRCYRKGLGRTYDVAGLNNWCQALITHQLSAGEVARSFALSDEAAALYTTNYSFIYMLYALCFDRTPDSGISTWTSYMAAGATREMVVAQFASSQEFYNLVATFGL